MGFQLRFNPLIHYLEKIIKKNHQLEKLFQLTFITVKILRIFIHMKITKFLMRQIKNLAEV